MICITAQGSGDWKYGGNRDRDARVGLSRSYLLQRDGVQLRLIRPHMVSVGKITPKPTTYVTLGLFALHLVVYTSFTLPRRAFALPCRHPARGLGDTSLFIMDQMKRGMRVGNLQRTETG